MWLKWLWIDAWAAANFCRVLTALNDIAVLELATNYGDDRWIPLADDEADAKLTSAGQAVAIAGWGEIWDHRLVDKALLAPAEQEQVFSPKVLQDAEVRIVDYRRCQARYANITDKHVCAGAPGKGICFGDSGGPLMVKAPNRSGYIQIGIATAVQVCGDPAFPGVFTRVSPYKDWVARKISGQ